MAGNTLNELAQQRFENLKSKMKLNFIKEQGKEVDRDKIDKLFNEPEKEQTINNIYNEEKKENFVDQTFNFIGSLNLNPQLSLAIGLIISGHKENSMVDINQAIQTLEDYIIGKGEEETNS